MNQNFVLIIMPKLGAFEKFLQQFYCPCFSISLSDFFIVIPQSPEAGKLVANRYSFFFLLNKML